MNTLEERIVDELRAERDLVPDARPGPVPAGRSWRWPAGIAAAVLAVVGVAWVGTRLMNNRSDLPTAAAVAAGEITIDGSVVLPISDTLEPITAFGSRMEVFAGAQAPPLAVDIDLGGAEQPLVASVPKWDPTTSAGDVPVVYVGNRSGRSLFVHTNGTIGWLDRVLSGGELSDHICMSIGDSSSALGGSGFCSSAAGAHGGQLHDNSAGAPVEAWWATWIDVPEGTAIVTMVVGDELVAWQRPVGETAFFDLSAAPAGAVTMTAIGVDGIELDSTSVPAAVFDR